MSTLAVNSLQISDVLIKIQLKISYCYYEIDDHKIPWSHLNALKKLVELNEYDYKYETNYS